MGKDEIDRDEGKEEERKSNVIVVTDACLPLIGSGESPVSACILINYELPSKKVCVLCINGFLCFKCGSY